MRGRRISYSAEELAFVEARKHMRRAVIHAAFVQAFSRTDVTRDHIKSLCTRSGWDTGRMQWSAVDDARLRELYPDTPTKDVARQLGRTLSSTYRRAYNLDLVKSEAFLAGPYTGRIQPGRNLGAASRFRKGNVPANKGKRQPGFGPGRMKETQFAKGQASWNLKPVGSERIIDGYRWTKVSDTRNVIWTANWKQTHIICWEKANGPLPEGMALKCLGDDRSNTDLSNWELIPRGLLPRLNARFGRRYDSAPAELKPTIMAAAKIAHAVRERKRRGVA